MVFQAFFIESQFQKASDRPSCIFFRKELSKRIPKSILRSISIFEFIRLCFNRIKKLSLLPQFFDSFAYAFLFVYKKNISKALTTQENTIKNETY